MLTLTTLASGSSGNCTLISGNGIHLLIDAGISARRITVALRAMGIEPTAISGILITHEHSDHISGLSTLSKQRSIPVFSSVGTGAVLCQRIPLVEASLTVFEPGQCFSVGALTVETFPTLHDAAQPTGYAITDGTRKVAVVTDLGVVTAEVLAGVAGAHLLVVESNHDVEWVCSGGYPSYLKQRILGRYGHLSNESGGALARQVVEQGAHTVVLAHLSSENNTPERARSAAELALAGCTATVAVAPKGETGPHYQV